MLAQIESGQRLKKQGVEELVKGSSLSAPVPINKVYGKDWYLTASKALELGLVQRLISEPGPVNPLKAAGTPPAAPPSVWR